MEESNNNNSEENVRHVGNLNTGTMEERSYKGIMQSPEKKMMYESMKGDKSSGIVKILAEKTPAYLQDLKSVEIDWKTRSEHLQELSKLFSWDSKSEYVDNVESSRIVTGLEELVPCLLAQLGDIRSMIVKDACTAIQNMSGYIGIGFKPVATALWQGLFPLTYNTIGVISSSGHACIQTVIKYSRVDLDVLIAGCYGKNEALRASCAEYVTDVIENWPKAELEPSFTALLKCMSHCVRDAGEKVRRQGRFGLVCLATTWNDRVEEIVKHTDRALRQALMREHGSSVLVKHLKVKFKSDPPVLKRQQSQRSNASKRAALKKRMSMESVNFDEIQVSIAVPRSSKPSSPTTPEKESCSSTGSSAGRSPSTDDAISVNSLGETASDPGLVPVDRVLKPIAIQPKGKTTSPNRCVSSIPKPQSVGRAKTILRSPGCLIPGLASIKKTTPSALKDPAPMKQFTTTPQANNDSVGTVDKPRVAKLIDWKLQRQEEQRRKKTPSGGTHSDTSSAKKNEQIRKRHKMMQSATYRDLLPKLDESSDTHSVEASEQTAATLIPSWNSVVKASTRRDAEKKQTTDDFASSRTCPVQNDDEIEQPDTEIDQLRATARVLVPTDYSLDTNRPKDAKVGKDVNAQRAAEYIEGQLMIHEDENSKEAELIELEKWSRIPKEQRDWMLKHKVRSKNSALPVRTNVNQRKSKSGILHRLLGWLTPWKTSQLETQDAIAIAFEAPLQDEKYVRRAAMANRVKLPTEWQSDMDVLSRVLSRMDITMNDRNLLKLKEELEEFDQTELYSSHDNRKMPTFYDSAVGNRLPRPPMLEMEEYRQMPLSELLFMRKSQREKIARSKIQLQALKKQQKDNEQKIIAEKRNQKRELRREKIRTMLAMLLFLVFVFVGGFLWYTGHVTWTNSSVASELEALSTELKSVTEHMWSVMEQRNQASRMLESLRKNHSVEMELVQEDIMRVQQEKDQELVMNREKEGQLNELREELKALKNIKKELSSKLSMKEAEIKAHASSLKQHMEGNVAARVEAEVASRLQAEVAIAVASALELKENSPVTPNVKARNALDIEKRVVSTDENVILHDTAVNEPPRVGDLVEETSIAEMHESAADIEAIVEDLNAGYVTWKVFFAAAGAALAGFCVFLHSRPRRAAGDWDVEVEFDAPSKQVSQARVPEYPSEVASPLPQKGFLDWISPPGKLGDSQMVDYAFQTPLGSFSTMEETPYRTQSQTGLTPVRRSARIERKRVSAHL